MDSMDCEPTGDVTIDGMSYILHTRLFERHISQNNSHEYHAAWIATTAANKKIVFKVIQELAYERDDWTDEKVFKYKAGDVGLARAEKEMAAKMNGKKCTPALPIKHIQRRQIEGEAYPGRDHHILLFKWWTPPDDIAAIKATEFEQGFGDDVDAQPLNDVTKALVAALEDIWKYGCEYHGPWEWFAYSATENKWRVN